MFSFYKILLKILLLSACFSINLFAQIAPFKQVDSKTWPNDLFTIMKNTKGVVIAGGEGKAAVNIKTKKYFAYIRPYVDENIKSGTYDPVNNNYLVLTNNGYNLVSHLYSTTFNGTAKLLYTGQQLTSVALSGNDMIITGNKKLVIGKRSSSSPEQWALDNLYIPDPSDTNNKFKNALNDVKKLPSGRTLVVGSNSTTYYKDDLGNKNSPWHHGTMTLEEFLDGLKMAAIHKSSSSTNKKVQSAPVFCVGNQWQTNNGVVVRSLDDGVTWDSVFAVPNITLTAVSVGSNTNAIIGGNVYPGGRLYYTKDGGDTWSKGKGYDSTYNIYAITHVSADSAYAVGRRGLILLTTDGGENWSEIARDKSPSFDAIYFSSPSIGFALGLGLNSGVYKTTDAGENWNEIYADSSFSVSYLSSIFFMDDMTGFITGSKIYKTIDGGMTWNNINTGVSSYAFRGIYFVNNNLGYAVFKTYSNGDGVIRTTDGGKTWKSLNINHDKNDKRYIYFVDENLGFVSGYSTLYRTTDGGDNWDTLAVASGPTPGWVEDLNSKVTFINSSTGFFGRKGHIFKTTDKGDTWTDAPIDDYTEPQQIQFLSDSIGYAICTTDTFGMPLHVFYKTTDGGKSWVDLTSQLPGSDGYGSLFFTDENTGFLAGPAGIIKTTTGGETITSVNLLNNTSLPSGFKLCQNYPNPFNPITKIKYSIPVGTQHAVSVQLKIYDILGREVITLVNKQQQPGNYEIEFNASRLASGIYFYRLKAGSFSNTKKLVLLK